MCNAKTTIWNLVSLASTFFYNSEAKQRKSQIKLSVLCQAGRKKIENVPKSRVEPSEGLLHTISFRYHWLWFPIKSAFLNGSANPANTTKDRHQPTQESNKNSLNYGTPFFLICYPSLAIKPDAQVWSSIRITNWKYMIHRCEFFWGLLTTKLNFVRIRFEFFNC